MDTKCKKVKHLFWGFAVDCNANFWSFRLRFLSLRKERNGVFFQRLRPTKTVELVVLLNSISIYNHGVTLAFSQELVHAVRTCPQAICRSGYLLSILRCCLRLAS